MYKAHRRNYQNLGKTFLGQELNKACCPFSSTSREPECQSIWHTLDLSSVQFLGICKGSKIAFFVLLRHIMYTRSLSKRRQNLAFHGNTSCILLNGMTNQKKTQQKNNTCTTSKVKWQLQTKLRLPRQTSWHTWRRWWEAHSSRRPCAASCSPGWQRTTLGRTPSFSRAGWSQGQTCSQPGSGRW